jgi:hypothetical protein
MNLNIESFEGGFYLCQIEDKDKSWYIYDAKNSPKRFNCLNEIKSFLSDERFDKVWLKQNTPYDEMCGMPVKSEAMQMEIDWH